MYTKSVFADLSTSVHVCPYKRMVTMSNENFMSKVIRIQDDEKELLSRLHKIYGKIRSLARSSTSVSS